MSEVLYKPRPERWLTWRFSLRTVFVLLTLFCVWLGVQAKWIRDRHEARKWIGNHGWFSLTDESDDPFENPFGDRPAKAAPWSIRILGEPGIGSMSVKQDDDWNQARLRSLFPEAEVSLRKAWHPPERVLDEADLDNPFAEFDP